MLIKTTSFFLLLQLLCLLLAPATAAQLRGTIQNPETTRQVAEQFLHTQATALPGEIDIVLGTIDSRLQLPACDAAEAFLPPGSRPWGKTTVGVRCRAPMPWTVYISATVHVKAEYLVTSVPLSQGKIIGQNDIIKLQGDLATLPAGVLTDPAQAIGRMVGVSLSSGMPLRQDALRIQQAVQQGQMVRLISAGPGFSISTDAKAMTGGAEGQLVQAKTNGGQIVSGIAKLGGIVEIAY